MARPRKRVGELGAVSTSQINGGVRARTSIRLKDGSYKRISARGDTEAEARAALEKQARGLWGGLIRVVTPESSILELASVWLEDVQKRGKITESSWHAYAATVRTIIDPVFGAYTVEQLDAGIIDNELLNLSIESRSKAKKARSVLRGMFKVAIRHRAVSFNPVDATDSTPPAVPVNSVVSGDQLAMIVQLLGEWQGRNPGRRGGARPNNQLVSDLLVIMLATSQRIGEVVTLTLDDVLEVDGRMHVAIHDTVQIIPGKGLVLRSGTKHDGQQRYVPLPRFAEEVIRRRTAGYVQNAGRLLFTSRNGTMLAPGNIRRSIRDFRQAFSDQLEAAGVDVAHFTPKTMRKSAATAVERGASLVDAQKLLGHRHPGTTSTSYVKQLPFVSPRIADTLEAAYPLLASTEEERAESED